MTLENRSRSSITELVRDVTNMHVCVEFGVNRSRQTGDIDPDGQTDRQTDGRTDGRTDRHTEGQAGNNK